MNDFKGTPGYDHWIARKIGCERRMSRALLERYQVDRLNTVIRHAYARSSFYKRHLRECRDVPLVSPADLERLPFTTPQDVRDSGLKMLCVNQGGISRVVTLPTSGTTGQPKRLYFTDQDQALSLDAFVQSMSQLVRAGDLVYILLPAKRPGGVGDLLHQAVSRLHAVPVKYGLVSNLPEMLEHLLKLPIRCLVGIPVQVLALTRYFALKSAGRPVALRNVLLCTDHVSRAIREEVQQIWDCRVFDYYGMTEAGFCGGMECPAHCGYHLHEADLYIEIIDPESGRAAPEGYEGEVVVSTLTRCGMPLLRYRTGDLSRFVPGFCSCGSILRRIEKIRARKTGLVSMG
ncbi:MAG: AMP-binding protein, partial [Desulfovibrio sp.]|nr:AMP-binding protein [Desulfovibrio sp.]